MALTFIKILSTREVLIVFRGNSVKNTRLYLYNVKVMNPDRISTKKWVQRYIKVRYPGEEFIASLLFWIFAWPAA